MTTMANHTQPLTTPEYDLSHAVHANRLIGIWRLSRGFRWAYLAATVSLGIAAAGRAGAYLTLRYLVDTVLVGNRFGRELAYVVVAFLAASAAEGLFSYLSGLWAAQTAEGVAMRLRNYLFDHIQRLSFTYHDYAQTGDLIARCTSDIDSVRRLFADQAIGIGRIISLFLINLIALVRLNAPLAWLACAVLPLLFVASALFGRRVGAAFEAYQAQEARVCTVLQENLTAVRVVRAFARQDFERDKFDRENALKLERARGLWTMHALYWPISDTLCGLQMLLCVWVGALRAIDKVITPGTYVAYLGIVIGIIWPMRNLGRLIVNMSTGLVSYVRLRDVMQQPREPLDQGDYVPPAPLRGELAFDNVSFHYQSGHEAISNVSFTCQPGQIIALLGSTGSGKTTLATCCLASTTMTRVPSCWTASSSNAIPAATCGSRSASSNRNRSSSLVPFVRTSAMVLTVRSATTKSSRPRALRQSTSRSALFPRATTPVSTKGASPCPAVRSSASPSPAHCSRTRASSSWTTRPLL